MSDFSTFDPAHALPPDNKRVLVFIDLLGQHVTDRSFWMVGVWDGRVWRESHCGPVIEDTHRVWRWTDLPAAPRIEGALQ